MSDFAAVVLAGGAARRMGGAAKPARPVGGIPMLTRVLAAAVVAKPRVVVGPLELTAMLPPGTSLTVEDPPGGGPVAGIAAGMALLTDPIRDVAVLAADLPFLDHGVLVGLRRRLSARDDVAVLVDDTGRRQWLCAVWRRTALAARLASLGDGRGRSMRDLADGLAVVDVRAPGPHRPPPWFDCDTDEDVQRAEEIIHDTFG
jgi:molybdopterin-guanine dinucleotide biosynthesis protein A